MTQSWSKKKGQLEQLYQKKMWVPYWEILYSVQNNLFHYLIKSKIFNDLLISCTQTSVYIGLEKVYLWMWKE